MDWVNFFFSFKGRFNRARYWGATGIFALVTIAFVVLAILTLPPPADWSPEDSALILLFVVAFAAAIPLFISSLAIAVKRLHDRDRSGHWLWLFYFASPLLSAIAEVSKVGGPVFLLAAVVLSPLAFGLSIWGFVEIGILKGTNGPNRFGDDPLGASNAKANTFG